MVEISKSRWNGKEMGRIPEFLLYCSILSLKLKQMKLLALFCTNDVSVVLSSKLCLEGMVAEVVYTYLFPLIFSVYPIVTYDLTSKHTFVRCLSWLTSWVTCPVVASFNFLSDPFSETTEPHLYFLYLSEGVWVRPYPVSVTKNTNKMLNLSINPLIVWSMCQPNKLR